MNRLEETHTSLDLSKYIKEIGIDLETELNWCITDFACRLLHEADERITYKEHIPAYDILNDICGRYAKEIFGEDKRCYEEKEWCDNCQESRYIYNRGCRLDYKVMRIWELLQQGKKKEAEEYIKENIITNELPFNHFYKQADKKTPKRK